MKKLLYYILISLSVMIASCSKDSEKYSDDNWFNGKSFSTLAQTNDGRTVWMVFECRHKPNTEKDYSFTITPYDLYGNRLSDVRSYSGQCTIDADKIFLSYNQTSMVYNWTFAISENQGWPNYEPNITIAGSTSTSSRDPFAFYEFSSGKGWEQPADESTETINELYLIGSIQNWNIADGSMKFERIAKGIFYGKFPVNNHDEIEFRFYSCLGSWGGDGCDFSFGPYSSDFEILDIALPYNGKIVNGKGRWRVDNFTGKTLCITVDFNNMNVYIENEFGVSYMPKYK